jgi:hypothetical protein
MRGSGQHQGERAGRGHAGHGDRGGGGADLVPAAFPGRDSPADPVSVCAAHVTHSVIGYSGIPARTFSIASEPRGPRRFRRPRLASEHEGHLKRRDRERATARVAGDTAGSPQLVTPVPAAPPGCRSAGLTRRIRLMRRKCATIVTRILRVSHFLRVISPARYNCRHSSVMCPAGHSSGRLSYGRRRGVRDGGGSGRGSGRWWWQGGGGRVEVAGCASGWRKRDGGRGSGWRRWSGSSPGWPRRPARPGPTTSTTRRARRWPSSGSTPPPCSRRRASRWRRATRRWPGWRPGVTGCASGAGSRSGPGGSRPARPRRRASGAPYSARRAKAVRVRAAQPAGASAPATAMTRPASASRAISHGRYASSTEAGTAVCAA